jgi:glutathione S-transferase
MGTRPVNALCIDHFKKFSAAVKARNCREVHRRIVLGMRSVIEPREVFTDVALNKGPQSTRSLPMTPIITAFESSPDGGKGQARDMRVRWALEEVGQPYDVRLVSFKEMKEPGHLARQPFGQIPTYEEGGLVLFESGAIVLHIAETHAGLLPKEANGRARAIAWMFAAVSTVEPPIVEREQVEYTEGDRPWYRERLPLLDDRIRVRLDELSARLGDADWLDGAFSAGDLMMVMVLRRLYGMGILEEYAALSAYVARGEARPAFKRAYEAQAAVAEAAARR